MDAEAISVNVLLSLTDVTNQFERRDHGVPWVRRNNLLLYKLIYGLASKCSFVAQVLIYQYDNRDIHPGTARAKPRWVYFLG